MTPQPDVHWIRRRYAIAQTTSAPMLLKAGRSTSGSKTASKSVRGKDRLRAVPASTRFPTLCSVPRPITSTGCAQAVDRSAYFACTFWKLPEPRDAHSHMRVISCCTNPTLSFSTPELCDTPPRYRWPTRRAIIEKILREHAKDLQRLINKAQRLQREITDHLWRLHHPGAPERRKKPR
jgi:hypothetical protein